MGNKIQYFAIFLITLGFAIFSGDRFSRLLLLFLFLMAIILFVCARLQCGKIDKRLSPPVEEAARGQDIYLNVQLDNQSAMPVPYIGVELTCRDDYSGSVLRLQGASMLDRKGTSVLRFVLRAKYYGQYTVWGDQIKVSDMLGVGYAASRFENYQWKIWVLPELKGPEEIQNHFKEVQALRQDEDGTGIFGNEPSAAYELRPYQDGESLRNVHWKLTAKTGELVVKQFNQATEPMDTVFLDLNTNGKDYTREDRDQFLDTVAAFTAVRLREEAPFELVWLHAGMELHRAWVRNSADAKDALKKLLLAEPYQNIDSIPAYKEKQIHEAQNASIRIDLWGKITQEGAPI